MSEALAGTVADVLAEERRRAVRLLLAHPLVADARPDPEGFALIRRHARELQRWFAEQLGYRLVVDTEFARLHKRPAPGALPRPLWTRSRAAFDPRRYTLICLVLAALERLEVQTVLSELAEQVELLAASEEALRRFDRTSYAERQAFVDAVRWLVELGVLALADGEDVAFVEGRGDALYDIHARRLSQLLSTAVPASEPADPAELGAEAYPDTEEGRNRRSRHRLLRRLIEEPVLYLRDLDEAERAYLASQRHYLTTQVEQAGLVVEVRREGLAAIDPAGRLTDLAFPAVGTVSHAALLLAGYLAGRARTLPDRNVTVSLAECGTVLAGLFGRFGRFWNRSYQADAAGAGQLLAEALGRLQDLGLVRPTAEGVEPLPAIARYQAVDPVPPPGRGDAADV
jgi:uncharacterized protein (TIGR02678 family)